MLLPDPLSIGNLLNPKPFHKATMEIISSAPPPPTQPSSIPQQTLPQQPKEPLIPVKEENSDDYSDEFERDVEASAAMQSIKTESIS